MHIRFKKKHEETEKVVTPGAPDAPKSPSPDPIPADAPTRSLSLVGRGVDSIEGHLSLEKAGVSLEKAGVSLEKAGVSLEKAGVSLEKAGVSWEKAGVRGNKWHFSFVCVYANICLRTPEQLFAYTRTYVRAYAKVTARKKLGASGVPGAGGFRKIMEETVRPFLPFCYYS